MRPRSPLPLLSAAQFLVVVDYTVITVALARIQIAFGVSPTELQWVVTAYALTFGGFMLLGGRTADRYGPGGVLVVGLLLSAGASLVGGVAGSFAVLIAARAAQGLAGAMVVPSALALLSATFPPGPARTRALSINGSVISAGLASGSVIGGLITGTLGWRAVLLANVPVALALSVGAWLVVPSGRWTRTARGLDLKGAVIIVAAMSATIVGFGAATSSSARAASLLLAVSLFIALGVVESRAAEPLIPPRLIRDRRLVCASACICVSTAAMAGGPFIVTVYLQRVASYSPMAVALALGALGTSAVVAGAQTRYMIDRFGRRGTLVSGLIVEALGALLLATLALPVNVTVLLAGLILLGAGNVAVLISATVAATSVSQSGTYGVVAGALNTALELGGGAGVAVLASLATDSAHGATLRGSLTIGRPLAAGAGFVVLGVVPALALPNPSQQPESG